MDEMQNGAVDYPQMLRTSLAQGVPLERGLEFLRAAGASPMEAALAVRDVTGAPLEQAREVVAQSRAWSGPRSGAQPHATPRAWYGAIGQHGRSGHGAASVLPHLVRQGAGGAPAR